MRPVLLLLATAILLAVATSAPADWNPGTLAKYVQLPDLNVTGVDVNATGPFILADDFPCTEEGAITGIHVWGSWRNDYVPYGQIGMVMFTLSIHADIPASESPTGYSMPGATLWQRTFQPGAFTARVYADDLEEGWLDPPDIYVFPGDHMCVQYNFSIPSADAFYQEGTPEEPMVYWLDVQAMPEDPGAGFGWKTSLDHWSDDAVWGQGFEPFPGPWYELIYPQSHPMYPESIDLAFVIESQGGGPDEYDFGDAPDPSYPTLAASNGAVHTIVPGMSLGRRIDPEPDGQPHPNANGDDFSGTDDEDGVFFMEPFSSNEPSDMKILTTSAGVLDVWFDWAGDGSWAEPGDYMFGGIPVFAPGYTDLTVTPPADVVAGTVSFARVRFSSAGTPSYTGGSPDGEVEDYEFIIGDEYLFKWDAYPDITDLGIDVNCTAPYILADDFECEEPGWVTEIHIWGSWLNDYLPFGDDPTAVGFTLSLHADIPADTLAGIHSMPGDVLWVHDFAPGEFMCQIWRDQLEEGWMDPPDASIFPADNVCWHYAFFVDPENAFLQLGTEEDPIVYWLDVQATPLDQSALFGWKTAYEHWNDDAVWGTGPEPYPGPWSELVYPYGPYNGESIDLSFAIYSDEGSGVDGPEAPARFNLRQNIPNPFNPSTAITYEVPAGGGHVTIEVFDVAGRLVATLVDDFRAQGVKAVLWNGTSDDGAPLASGIYFCRMTAPGVEENIKMLLMK